MHDGLDLMLEGKAQGPESELESSPGKEWSRSEKIALASLLIGILALIATWVVVPEVRDTAAKLKTKVFGPPSRP